MLPLRLRLTLLTAALVGATLLLFGLAVYLTLAGALADEVDRALVDRARVVVGAIDVRPTAEGLTAELPNVNAIAAGNAVVQVVGLDGKVLARSRSLDGFTLPVSAEALAAAARGRSQFGTLTLEEPPPGAPGAGATGTGAAEVGESATGRTELRLYSVPVVLGGTPRAMLQVARPLAPVTAALARLRLVLASGAIFGVGACALAGLLISRAALRPIDRLTREAEQIGAAEDFGRRVARPGTHPNDEVGRLAATFNAMLDRLQAAYRRQEVALESQRRFVADASHELRTPLTTVRGNASLLRRLDELTPEDRAGTIDQIATEAERMSRLVNDLLTLARADAGRHLEHQPVALGPLVAWGARQAAALAGGTRHIAIAGPAGPAGGALAGGPGGQPDAVVQGDPDALRQLLLILVENAVKYTPAGGSITLQLDAPPAGETGPARISVVDSGVGIDVADLPHVFERFYRADRARQAGGTGLGLSIGQWIAAAHGGQITVHSTPGEGSVFTVALPATTLPRPRPSLVAAPPPVAIPLPVSGAARPALVAAG